MRGTHYAPRYESHPNAFETKTRENVKGVKAFQQMMKNIAAKGQPLCRIPVTSAALFPSLGAAADQRLDAPLTQESSQRPVAAAGGVHHLAGSHRSVFHLIDLESLRVPKMLKDLSILICHCYFHVLSLLFHPVLFHSRPSRAAALLPAGQAAVFAPAPPPAPAAAAPAAAVLRLTAQVVSAPWTARGLPSASMRASFSRAES